MINILIIGKNSFIAKNFIYDFKNKVKIFYFNKIFKKNKKLLFEKDLYKVVKKNKISTILNFAANNDNSYSSNFSKILESNFYLPLSILNISNKFKIKLFLFLSKDMSENKKNKNFYALSKEMLKVYLTSKDNNCKLRLLNIDSIFGPYDLNNRRIFPSIFKHLYKKKKKNINFNQVKNFTFVKDLNRVIFKLLSNKDKFIYKDIKSNKINLNKLYKLLKLSNINKITNKRQYQALFLTLEWYKKYYGKK